MFELKLLTPEHAEEYFVVTNSEDIRAQFPRLTISKEQIIASVREFNKNTDLSMVLGIFNDEKLIGHIDCYRKMDPEMRSQFLHGEDEFRELFDEEFKKTLDERQLAVSPHYINISIGVDFRGKGYAKEALTALMIILNEMDIQEVFMVVEAGNAFSLALAKSMGAEMISEDFYYKFKLKVSPPAK